MNKTFKIPHDLQEIISRCYLDKDSLTIELTEKYQNRKIKVPLDKTNIQSMFENFEQEVKDSLNITSQEYINIEGFIHDIILSLEMKSEENLFSHLGNNKKKLTVNKYSQNRKGDLYESIILDGESLFLNIDDKDEIFFQPFLEEKTRILYPPSLEEYLHTPYEFASEDEIVQLINRVKNETIFSLYAKGKSIVSKYIDQEEHIISLTNIDLIFSYFQDRFPTVHYLGIFGDNNSGKSSIGDVFEALAYRTVNTTDPSPANIFRSLGPVEPGQITLVLDEAEKIDQSYERMTILKTGYDYRKTVSKVNDLSRKPEKFFTYCQKLIIGERAPSPNLAKGLNERILSDIVYYGTPSYDIKEILNTTVSSDEEYKTLFKEIDDFRKLLFVYRLIHYKNHIKNIHIGITGRKKELVKPYLQLFSNTKTDLDRLIFQEIENTFNILLKIKNDKRDFTIEAALVPIIIDLMAESKNRMIKFSDCWNRMKQDIEGHFDDRRPNEYHTADFGIIYRNSISHTLQKLGIECKRHNKFIELIFHPKKIMKIASQYNITIQTILPDLQGERSECSERSIDSLVQIISIVKEKQTNNVATFATKDNENGLNNDKDHLKDTLVKTSENNKDDPDYMEPSQHTQRSPTENDLDIPNYSLYRIGKTDTWGCEKCNLRDDIWFMQQHPCKGA